MERKVRKAPRHSRQAATSAADAFDARQYDPELRSMHRSHAASPAFSFWSAVKYVTLLSILLWWLPIFGQMIAGYVGGRRAGSPFRAILAALIPVVMLWLFFTGVHAGVFGDPAAVLGLPTRIVDQASAAPVIGPYAQFASGYMHSFLASVTALTTQSLNGFLVTLVFAYIGGILAEQARREMDSRPSSTVGVSILQPILPSRRHASPEIEGMNRVPYSAEAADEGEAAPSRARAAQAAKSEALEAGDEDEAPPSKPARAASHRPAEPGKPTREEKFVSQALRRYDRASKSR